jgi:hypothetical protein
MLVFIPGPDIIYPGIIQDDYSISRGIFIHFHMISHTQPYMLHPSSNYLILLGDKYLLLEQTEGCQKE